MNKINKKVVIGSLAFLGSVVMFTACKNPLAQMIKLADQQKLTVEPSPLELHGDKVNFTVGANLPVAMMKKGSVYELEVHYIAKNIETVTDDGKATPDISVGKISFDGDKYAGQKSEPRETRPFGFGYEDRLKEGGLMVKGNVFKKGKEKDKKSFGPVRMRANGGQFVKGISTTALLVKAPASGLTYSPTESPFASVDHNLVAPQPTVKPVRLDFERGSANVNPAVGDNKNTFDMVDLFVKEQIPPFEATVTGTHSPEGSEAVNTNLANARAKAVETAFMKTMQKYNYKKEDLTKYRFNLNPVTLKATLPEFYSLLDQSSLPAEAKSEIKSILNEKGDFVENERKLAAKPYYNNLMNEVYPKLRYAKTEVMLNANQKTPAELSALAKRITEGKEAADKLSEEEYLFVAQNTPDLKERIAILKAAASKYDTWKIQNNLGAAYLDQSLLENDKSKIDMALSALNNSISKKETAEAYYNIAMAYAMQGKMKECEENLKKALNVGSSNPKVNKLLKGASGYFAIRAAETFDSPKYKEAVDLLNDAQANNPNLFNKGLAQLLSRRYDEAIASFNAALQKNNKDAITYYALAITAARKNDENAMASNLKKACELNSDLKAKAIKDVEFDKYKSSGAFKDAIK
ncbi:MAG: tetratricopeptide repeat protein [Microscillaceae bacterium]|nr:tetratricopeptide repeat protein [Microscillaceae bacterium]MDW8460673.1 tetratricopeptide repeat protein [Cytophagales bacterium]